MKKTRIIYWTTTALFCLLMLFSAFNYLTNPEMKSAFAHLGFPDYFRVELAIAKILGALALLLPFTKGFKYFAYAGFAITVISATIAHIALSDPLMVAIAPVIFLVVLVVSFFYYEKMVRELKTAGN